MEMFPRLLCSSPIHSCRIPRICQLESPEAAAGGPGPPRAPARGRALAMAPSPGREGGSAAGARTARVGRASALTRALGPSLLLTRGVIRVPRHIRGPRERQLQSKGCTGGMPRPWKHPGSRHPALERSSQVVVITGFQEVSLSGLETWGMGAAGDEGSCQGTLGERPPPCFSPVGGDTLHPPFEGRGETATVSPGFVPAARLENASVGRLDGWGGECRFSL